MVFKTHIVGRVGVCCLLFVVTAARWGEVGKGLQASPLSLVHGAYTDEIFRVGRRLSPSEWKREKMRSFRTYLTTLRKQPLPPRVPPTIAQNQDRIAGCNLHLKSPCPARET